MLACVCVGEIHASPTPEKKKINNLNFSPPAKCQYNLCQLPGGPVNLVTYLCLQRVGQKIR